jgi:hypothetical protein
MPVIQDNNKTFQTPESGTFIGTLIDVVDLGIVNTQYGPKAKLRLVWVLGKIDGSGYAVDTDGVPFRVISQVNASANEKSTLYKLAKGILGAPPPAPFNTDILIGKSNMLFVVKETAPDGKIYANVQGVLPMPAGVPALPAPPGFVRSQDKPKSTYGAPSAVAQGGQSSQIAQAPAQVQQQSVAQTSAPVVQF